VSETEKGTRIVATLVLGKKVTLSQPLPSPTATGHGYRMTAVGVVAHLCRAKALELRYPDDEYAGKMRQDTVIHIEMRGRWPMTCGSSACVRLGAMAGFHFGGIWPAGSTLLATVNVLHATQHLHTQPSFRVALRPWGRAKY